MFSKLLVASLLIASAVLGQFNPQVKSGVHTVSRTDLYLLKKLQYVASSCAASYDQYCKDEGLTKGMVPCLISHGLDLNQECLESLKDYPLAYCFVEAQTHCQSLLPMTPSQLFYCLWSQVDGLTDSECVAGLRHGNEELGGDEAGVVDSTVVVQTETADPDLAFTDFTRAPDVEDEDEDEVEETRAPRGDRRRPGNPKDGRGAEDEDEDEDDEEETRQPRRDGRPGPPRRRGDDDDDDDEERSPKGGDSEDGEDEEKGRGRRHRRPSPRSGKSYDDEDEEFEGHHGHHPRGHPVFAGLTVLFVGLGLVALVKRIVRRRRAAALEGSYQNVPAGSYA